MQCNFLLSYVIFHCLWREKIMAESTSASSTSSVFGIRLLTPTTTQLPTSQSTDSSSSSEVMFSSGSMRTAQIDSSTLSPSPSVSAMREQIANHIQNSSRDLNLVSPHEQAGSNANTNTRSIENVSSTSSSSSSSSSSSQQTS